MYPRSLTSNPSFSRSATTRLRASKRSRPAYWPAAAVILAVFVDHLDHGQVVAAAGFEIVRVVRRRHFDHAGAEFGIGQIVEDDGNLAIHQRQLDGLAVQVEYSASSLGLMATAVSPSMVSGRVVATVRIAVRAAIDRVADVPEAALRLLVV